MIFVYLLYLETFYLNEEKVLNLILEEEFLKNLKKYADREGISIEEYVKKVLEKFNNVR